MKKLPYRVETQTGDVLDVVFPLHGETGDIARVGELVSILLGALDREIAFPREISNGDVLQAIAMVMAIRAGMIHTSRELTGQLSRELLDTALDAMAEAARRSPTAGHA